ncbi:MAG: DUF721 domain-containing protein [Flavobacteriales bacterium]|nr:DUF721 domain-containing protein [Flavobacteriales bacterium]MBL4734047.1 DUF721 domain-containing protein [Flavobacteriales bacterium]PCH88018.1 MAG: hypothetical protein COB88_04715 [Flavobacteriales bacterium]
MEHNLKDSIKAFLKANNLEEKLMEVRIKACWEKLMGNGITQHTTSIVLRNGKLYLTFDSAALKQELTYSKSKVIEMMNKDLGEEAVNEIIIR